MRHDFLRQLQWMVLIRTVMNAIYAVVMATIFAFALATVLNLWGV